MKGINLLEKSAIETKELREIERKIRVYSILILLSLAIFNLFITLYARNQAKKLQDLKLALMAKENLVVSYKDREIKYRVLKEKVSFFSTAPKEQINTPVLISFFENLSNLGITVENIKISQERIIFSGTTQDSDILASGLTLLVEEEGKKLFKTVNLSSLTKAEKGGYRFDVLLSPNIAYEGI